MTITTIPGHTYIVTSPTEVSVSTPSGVVIGLFPANVQSSFIAPTYELVTSTDAALITQSEDSGVPTTADNTRYAPQDALDKTNSLLSQTREELAAVKAELAAVKAELASQTRAELAALRSELSAVKSELAALRQQASQGILSSIWQRIK